MLEERLDACRLLPTETVGEGALLEILMGELLLKIGLGYSPEMTVNGVVETELPEGT